MIEHEVLSSEGYLLGDHLRSRGNCFTTEVITVSWTKWVPFTHSNQQNRKKATINRDPNDTCTVAHDARDTAGIVGSLIHEGYVVTPGGEGDSRASRARGDHHRGSDRHFSRACPEAGRRAAGSSCRHFAPLLKSRCNLAGSVGGHQPRDASCDSRVQKPCLRQRSKWLPG